MTHDDPRLTRYALGEMNDEDRAAFEATITGADRAEVTAIRALGAALKADLVGALPHATTARPIARRRTYWLLAAAASVAVVGLTAGALSTRHAPIALNLRQVGQRSLLYSNENHDALKFAQTGAVQGPSNLVRPTITIQRESDTASFPLLETDSRNVSVPTPGAAATDVKQVEVRAESAPAANLPTLAQTSTVGRLQQRFASIAPSSASPAVRKERIRAPAEKAKRPFDASEPSLVPVDRAVAQDERRGQSGESYAPIVESHFLDPRSTPLSTFGVDVDTASYANVRRFLTAGQRPPADAVRVEELINYFPTGDAPPTDGRPFAVHAEIARCPWNASHDLVRVALKAREIAVDKRPSSNLVFLIDVSGSMNEPDKLPLVKRGLEKLVDQLGENDRVGIVVYAGNAGLVLPSTNASDKAAIRQAIDRLEAGGSTNGGQGIELAYATAAANFVRGGANRVILCTDGDFNVGVTDHGSLLELIQDKAKAGTFLSVLGFGTGNVKDDTMEMLADKGNGNYAYIDTDREARKVLVQQASGTLVTVAKDVKIQVEFNPQTVSSYRLIGYENRALAKEDFNNDLKDAGEIGAGHNVVALYEIERQGHFSDPVTTDKLKYQPAPTSSAPVDGELLTLKLRYKAPDAPLEQGVSQLIEQPLMSADRAIDQASADFQFDAAVAGFGMLLRGSTARGDCDWSMVTRLAKAGLAADAGGYRAEFLTLVEKAAGLGR